VYTDQILFEVATLGTLVDYTSVDEIINYLELEEPIDHVFISGLVSAATGIIDDYCRRSFQYKTISAERHLILEGQSAVFLREFPVISISSAAIEGSDISSDSYDLDAISGRIRFSAGLSQGDLLVTYISGVKSVPQPIHLAATKLVSLFYQRRKREGLSSERLLGYGYSLQGDIYQDIKELLNGFRHVRVG